MNENEVMQEQELKCDETACAICGMCEEQESTGFTRDELLETISTIGYKIDIKVNHQPDYAPEFSKRELEALAIAHSLLIPVEILNVEKSESPEVVPTGNCPRCGSVVLAHFRNCHNCGQAFNNEEFVNIEVNPENGISLDTPINIELEEEPKVERSVIPDVVQND